MRNRDLLNCTDCYFRQMSLCAIPGDVVCPTFRAATITGRLGPPRPEPPRPNLVLVGTAQPSGLVRRTATITA